MQLELKIQKIGDSIGVIIPQEALQQFKLQTGDTVMLIDESTRTLEYAHSQVEMTRQLGVALAVMKRYRRTFGELAK